MNFISSMLIAAILISITISLLIIMTMISIIGIRKELRIKNLYTRRMCINYPYNVQLSDLELVLTAQAAENKYVGVACGKLDQSCEIYSKKDHLLYKKAQTHGL